MAQPVVNGRGFANLEGTRLSGVTRLIFAVAMAIVGLIESLPVPTLAASGQQAPPNVLSAAKDWFYRFQTGRVDRSQFNAEVNSELTEAMVRKEMTTLKRFGSPSAFSGIVKGSSTGGSGSIGYGLEHWSNSSGSQTGVTLSTPTQGQGGAGGSYGFFYAGAPGASGSSASSSVSCDAPSKPPPT